MNLIRLIVFSLSVVLISCHDSESKSETKETGPQVDWIKDTYEITIKPLARMNRTDTLKIFVQIADCGEWGGHHEYFNLFMDADSKIKASLTIDSVNCHKYSDDQTFSGTRNVIFKGEKLLNENDEKRISDFIQKIVECNLQEEGISNAGDFYEIMNTDSSFYVTFWNSGGLFETGYYKMRNYIFNGILKLESGVNKS